MREILQQSVEDVIIARFPSVQALLTRRVRQLEDFVQLQKLRQAVLVAADLDEVERLLEVASRG